MTDLIKKRILSQLAPRAQEEVGFYPLYGLMGWSECCHSGLAACGIFVLLPKTRFYMQ